ncbi:MAG: universal stress protein [candidate division WOR-3 bacterium]|nr:MAG: universal stress protein [candidate division WOR-3 bacterium]
MDDRILPVKSILCPVDFSDDSIRALKKAEELALHFDAALLVLHVVTPIPTAGPTFDPQPDFDINAYQDSLRLGYQAELDRIVAEQLQKCTQTKAVVAVGDPADEILRVAGGEKVDMVVLSTHGETGWRHLVFGSVAERVVRHASCPVLTIRARPPADNKPGKGRPGES